MIPEAYIREWYEQSPWQTWSMVEQDLIISRMLVELFGNGLIAENLVFRGGTALHKLFLSRPLRYSEDIDLVQSVAGPIGPIFDQIQDVFRDWIGEPKRKVGPGSATLTYKVASEDSPPIPLRVKIEINTREHFHVQPVQQKSVRVQSRWFEGHADIPVYQADELLATKMRALYQRRKGRDLFDLAAALREIDVQPENIVEVFTKYVEAEGNQISGKNYRTNLLSKLDHPGFKTDCIPLLATGTTFDINADFELIDKDLLAIMNKGSARTL